MDVQTEKNCALCSHMYENAEDLTYVCTICWEANSIVNSFFFFFLSELFAACIAGSRCAHCQRELMLINRKKLVTGGV